MACNPRVAGIILAAGASTRMGRPKLALPYRGKPILHHVIRAALASRLSPLVAVAAPRDALLNPGVRESAAHPPLSSPGILTVINPDWRTGQASSLKAGIAALPPGIDGALILLGDMPLVSGLLIERILTGFTPGRFLIPRHEGTRGNPVIIPSTYFSHVLALSGDIGARPLFTAPGAPVDYFDVDDSSILTDVDTPQDYERLINHP